MSFHILSYCYTYISSQSIIVLLDDIQFFIVNILTSMVNWQVRRTLANLVYLRNGSAIAPFPDSVRVLILQGFAISLSDLDESKLFGIDNEMYKIRDILHEFTYTYVCHRAYQTVERGVTIEYRDLNYLNNISKSEYYDETIFNQSFRKTSNFSLIHLNIRSVPLHFTECMSYLDTLDIAFKIIALSETVIN